MTNFILTGAAYSGVDDLANLMVDRGVFRNYILTDRTKHSDEIDGEQYNPKAWKGSGIYPAFHFTDSRYSTSNFEDNPMFMAYVDHNDRYGIPARAFQNPTIDTVTVLPPHAILRILQNPDIYPIPNICVIWMNPPLADRLDAARQEKSFDIDDMGKELLGSELEFDAFKNTNLGDLGGKFGFAYDEEWIGTESISDFWEKISDAYSKHGYIQRVKETRFDEAAAHAVDVSDPVDLADLPTIATPAYLKSVKATIKKES